MKCRNCDGTGKCDANPLGRCPWCAGAGNYPDKPLHSSPCHRCKGTGSISVVTSSHANDSQVVLRTSRSRCPDCLGNGKVPMEGDDRWDFMG